MDGYLALVLDDESQEELQHHFPPKHTQVYSHHMTVVYKPDQLQYEKYSPLLGKVYTMTVVGYAIDAKGEAVLIETDISVSNTFPHVTISTAFGIPPVYSNLLMAKGVTKCKELLLSGKLQFCQTSPVPRNE